MWPIVTSVVCRSVCLSLCQSVCHTTEPRKNGYTDRDAVLVEDSGGPREPCVRWGPNSPIGRVNFEGEKGHTIVKYWESVVICVKTAKPIDITFGLWARMDRRNRVLGGGPEVLRDVAMATNFGAKIAVNWLCVNYSD